MPVFRAHSTLLAIQRDAVNKWFVMRNSVAKFVHDLANAVCPFPGEVGQVGGRCTPHLLGLWTASRERILERAMPKSIIICFLTPWMFASEASRIEEIRPEAKCALRHQSPRYIIVIRSVADRFPQVSPRPRKLSRGSIIQLDVGTGIPVHSPRARRGIMHRISKRNLQNRNISQDGDGQIAVPHV